MIVDPASSKSMPRNIMVGRIVTPLRVDNWVPMKVTNLFDKTVTLKKNCKMADVSPCLAVEDFEIFQNSCQVSLDGNGGARNNTESMHHHWRWYGKRMEV